jgi:hypothetical protein
MPKSPPRPNETHSIVIEGDLARVTRTTVERQVRTSDLLAEIAKQRPLQTGLLPRGCLAYTRASNDDGQTTTLYTIERPASVVIIRYKEAPSREGQTDPNITELCLSWPYTQWLVRHVGSAILDLHLTCTKTPIASLDDPIFFLPMPNIHEPGNGQVCLGNLVVPDTGDPAERTSRLIDAVLSSLWNHDLSPDLEPFGFESLHDWAARTRDDPDVGLTLDYKPHPRQTLAKLMATILGSHP